MKTKIFKTRLSFLKWRLKVNSRVQIGLVPTMGAIHSGHLGLVKRAKKENDLVVVSIFVNPTQFGPHEDFRKYPRNLKADAALLNSVGADVIWAPQSEREIYPKDLDFRVIPGMKLTNLMEGKISTWPFYRCCDCGSQII